MQNTSSSIEKDIRGFLVETFLFGRDQPFTNDDSFLENGLIDSTGVLELIGFIEEKYNIKVQEEEMIPENLDSIHFLLDFIRRKLQAPA
jgi:acyl carrier protein